MSSSALLRRLDAELGGGPRSWSDAVIVRNVGPLQTSAWLAGDVISNRGFNALLFDNSSLPTHFLKVRPLVHSAFTLEAKVTVQLSEHRLTRELVPRACSFVEGPARVLAEDFVHGESMEVLLRRRRPGDWHALAAEALQSASPLLDAIAEVTAAPVGATTDLSTLVDDVNLLETIGLGRQAARRIAVRFEASRLPAIPQHGDFWPRNVLMGERGIRVIDFENCGEVALPLYDTFHMIRGSADAACGGKFNWLEAWAECGSGARPLTEEVRKAARDLDLVEIESALIAYLVVFAAKLQRRGVAPHRFANRVNELNALPDLLERGALRRVIK